MTKNSLSVANKAFQNLKELIQLDKLDDANTVLQEIKSILLEFDSLPPINIDNPNANEERQLSRDILEYAVILSIKVGDKQAFERNISALKPYYVQYKNLIESPNTPTVIGLNLLFLLVENRLAEFHSELELLNENQKSHPNIAFCTQLDQHLLVGSYDQVLKAASKPPPQYSFFINSLIETVRVNIGECMSVSYKLLSISAATKMLMFDNPQETIAFLQMYHPTWEIKNDLVIIRNDAQSKSDEISALKLISQTITYATELERIV